MLKKFSPPSQFPTEGKTVEKDRLARQTGLPLLLRQPGDPEFSGPMAFRPTLTSGLAFRYGPISLVKERWQIRSIRIEG